MVISILASSISALEITFTYPAEVIINETFEVGVDADSSEIYDIKIFVHKSEDAKVTQKEYISEILGDTWQSSWFYIKEAFPEQKTFSLRVIDSPGSRELCVRFRKTNTQSTAKECGGIKVLNKEEPQLEKSELTEENNSIIQQDPKPLPQNQEQQILLAQPSSNSEKIKLASNTFEQKTKNKSSRNYIIYAFTAFLALLLILLALRRL